MGLHQAITDKNTAEPCDCGADDDHRVYTEDESEDQLVDYDKQTAHYDELDDNDVFFDNPEPLEEEEDVEDTKGFTTTEDRKHE